MHIRGGRGDLRNQSRIVGQHVVLLRQQRAQHAGQHIARTGGGHPGRRAPGQDDPRVPISISSNHNGDRALKQHRGPRKLMRAQRRPQWPGLHPLPGNNISHIGIQPIQQCGQFAGMRSDNDLRHNMARQQIQRAGINHNGRHALRPLVPRAIAILQRVMIQQRGNGRTLHAITGLVPIKSGSVIYDGHDLRKAEPSKIITYKLAHVPEGRHIFPQMTVEENLEMGAYADPAGMEETMKDVYKRFPRLDERRRQLAGTLSGGEQQMLAVGRALMAKPKMILMDEPSMGLSPLLVKEIFAIIQEVNKQGITILLVEQNAKMALAISDRAYVLETGNISIEGNAADLLNDPRVKKAYLGQ